MEMYKTQLEFLDEQKDLEENENKETTKKLQNFLDRELEKKKKLEQEVKKLESRSVQLTDTRTELFKQMKSLERVYDDKKEERNQLKARVEVKQSQLQ